MPVVRDEFRKKRRTDKKRTGCVICKKRRVKCGEEKPTCRRCVNGRWPCRYELTVVQEAPLTWSGSSSGSKSPSSEEDFRIVDGSPGGSPDALTVYQGKDLRGLKFFLEVVAPVIDIRSQDVWEKIIPQCAMDHASIRHALVAMSGFQEQYNARSRQVDPGTLTINGRQQERLLISYNKALRDLTETNIHKVPAIPRLVCCLLFIVIELVQGRLSSVKNLSGLARRMIFQARRVCTTASERAVLTAIQSPFRRLEMTIWTMCTDKKSEDMAMYHSSTAERPKDSEIPYHIAWAPEPASKEFQTLNGAYESITSIVHSWLDKRSRGVKDGEFKASLEDWRIRFDKLSLDESAKNALELYWHRVKSHVLLDTEEAADWTKFVNSDAYIPEYARLVDLAEKIEPGRGGCFIGSYTQNLFDLAMECKDPVVRRRAIAVIEKSDRQTGLLRSDWMAKIARRSIELEEQGRDVKTMNDIPKKDWIEDVRLDWDDDDGPLIVRYFLRDRIVSELLS